MSLEQDFTEELARLQPLLHNARSLLSSVNTAAQVGQLLDGLHDYTESVSLKNCQGKTNLYRYLRHGLKGLAIELGAHLPKNGEEIDLQALIQAFDDEVLSITNINAFIAANSGYEI